MHADDRTPQDEYDRLRLSRNLLSYGLATSIVGLPVGLWLGLPLVWGLSLLGIAVGSAKLWLRSR